MDQDRYETKRAQLQDALDTARAKADRLERRLKVLEALRAPEDEAAARELLAEPKESGK